MLYSATALFVLLKGPVKTKFTLLIYSKLHSKSCDYLYNALVSVYTFSCPWFTRVLHNYCAISSSSARLSLSSFIFTDNSTEQCQLRWRIFWGHFGSGAWRRVQNSRRRLAFTLTTKAWMIIVWARMPRDRYSNHFPQTSHDILTMGQEYKQ